MPRLAENAVPSYRCHKQSGQAIVTLSGRDHLLGPHNSKASRHEYDRLVSEWIAGGRHLPDRRQRQTIGDIVLCFWKHAKTYYRDADGAETGELENFRHAIRPLKAMYVGLPADEFTPSKLRAVRDAMIRPRQTQDAKSRKTITCQGWCRTHANRQVNRIRHIIKWAVGQELIPPTVHQALLAVEPLRRGRSEAREMEPVRPVSDQHVDQMLAALPPAVRALVELQELTGARGGELFKLRGIDIDTSPAIWIFKPRLHKTAYLGHEREIRFGPRAQEVLRPFLQSDLNAPLFSPAASEAERRADAHQKRKENGTALSCGNRPGSNRKSNPRRKPRETYDKNSYAMAIARACDTAFPPPERLARHRVAANGRKAKNVTRWETAGEWGHRLGDKAWMALPGLLLAQDIFDFHAEFISHLGDITELHFIAGIAARRMAHSD